MALRPALVLLASAYPTLHLAAGLLAAALAVGICVWHRLRRPTRTTDYLIGAGAWALSVALKIVLALLVFGALRQDFGKEIPLAVSIPTTGLLTGLTECVFVFFLARTRRWREANWDSGVALGLGFGCLEALALGLPLALGALAGYVPGWFEPDDAQSLIAGLSDPLRPIAFLWERAIALPVHVLTCVLILRSVREGRPSLFWWAFLLKCLIDAVPAEQLSKLGLEAVYGLFGIGSALLLRRFAQQVGRGAAGPSSRGARW